MPKVENAGKKSSEVRSKEEDPKIVFLSLIGRSISGRYVESQLGQRHSRIVARSTLIDAHADLAQKHQAHNRSLQHLVFGWRSHFILHQYDRGDKDEGAKCLKEEGRSCPVVLIVTGVIHELAILIDADRAER